MTQTNSADHASVRGPSLSAVPRFIYYDYEAPPSRPRLALKIGQNQSTIAPIINTSPMPSAPAPASPARPLPL